jgi:hypothetical protein
MRSILTLPVTSRRRLSQVLVALAVTWLGATAGQALAAGQDTAAAAQPPGRTFGSDAGMIFNTIKPDKTADFEMVMGKLKEALQKSEDATRKQQGASWKVFKSVEPGPNGNVLYIFMMDPVVKGADYSVSKILAEVFPTEVQTLYKTFSDAYAGGQNIVNLQLVSSFGAGGMGANMNK